MTSPANGDYNTRPISPTSQTQPGQSKNPTQRKIKQCSFLLSCLLIFHKMPWRSFRRFEHFVMQQILRQGRPAPAPSQDQHTGPEE